MKDRQPQKAERQLAALAMATAAIAAPATSEAFGSTGGVATGSIPTSVSTPPGGVVVGFCTVTPKTTGIFSVLAGLITNANANGAAQSFQIQLAVTPTAPTIGTTRLTPALLTIPAVTVNSGETATLTLGQILGNQTPGQTVYICLIAAQSVGGAFALGANAGFIQAQEIGA